MRISAALICRGCKRPALVSVLPVMSDKPDDDTGSETISETGSETGDDISDNNR